MSDFSIREIETYFNRIGCRYRSLGQNAMHTGLRCDVPYYRVGVPIEILINSHWVSIRGVLQGALPEKFLPTALAYIAELNAQLRLVRCTIVSGSIVIQADIVRARCDLEMVLEAITAILRYAACTILELSVLANNNTIAEVFMRLQQKKQRSSRRRPELEQALDFDIAANRLTN